MANPIVSRYQIGMELRRLREAKGFAQTDAARLLAAVDSKITKVETGKAALKVGEVRTLLTFYEVPEQEWPPLLQLAKDACRRTSHRVADYARKFAGLEAEASQIRTYEPETIYGLFQTEDYARAITLAMDPQRSADLVEQYVASRVERSKILTGDNPPHMWAVVNEGALRRLVGGPKVMSAQLDRLLEVTQLPTVAIHVLPYNAGAHAAMGSPFVVLELPTTPATRIVYLEDLTDAAYLDQPREVHTYSLVFDRLLSAALGTEGSKQLINEIRHEPK